MKALRIALFLAPVLVACGGPDEDLDDVTSDFADELEEGLSATRAGFTFDLAFSNGVASGARFKGTASETLTRAMAFIPDDEVGTSRLTGLKTFQTTFAAPQLSDWLGGRPVFFQLGFKKGGVEKSLVAKADFRAALVQRSGSTSLKPRAWFQAFRVGSDSVVRLRGSAPAAVSTVTAKFGTTTYTGKGVAKEWIVEIPARAFAEGVVANRTVSLTVKSGSTTLRAGFRAISTIGRLALDEGDAYEIWPAPTCTTTLSTCLAGAGSDTSACGDSFTVAACARQNAAPTGLSTADIAGFADAALEDLSSDFAPEFARMFGDTRGAQAWEGAAAQARIFANGLAGSHYGSDEATFNAVKAAALASLTTTFAHPLRVLTPTAPKPGDAANARAIGVEALLKYLDNTDLTQTEYSGTLETVIARNREAWIVGIADLSSGSGTASLLSQSGSYTLVGTVLSAHVEVTVSRTTGRATNVLFEID